MGAADQGRHLSTAGFRASSVSRTSIPARPAGLSQRRQSSDEPQGTKSRHWIVRLTHCASERENLIRDANAAEFIMASGTPALQGRTYESAVLRRFNVRESPCRSGRSTYASEPVRGGNQHFTDARWVRRPTNTEVERSISVGQQRGF